MRSHRHESKHGMFIIEYAFVGMYVIQCVSHVICKNDMHVLYFDMSSDNTRTRSDEIIVDLKVSDSSLLALSARTHRSTLSTTRFCLFGLGLAFCDMLLMTVVASACHVDTDSLMRLSFVCWFVHFVPEMFLHPCEQPLFPWRQASLLPPFVEKA